MHSRIFQVSKNKITEDNRIEEYRYDDGFVGRVADYVVKSDNIKTADLLTISTILSSSFTRIVTLPSTSL